MQDKELEELLNLLQEVEANVEVEESGCSFEKFIGVNGIRSGSERVPNYLIYYTYKHDPNIKDHYGKTHFFRLMSKRFESVRTGKQRCYLLDGSAFDLTRQGKLKAKHYDEEERREKEKHKG